jgi:hypothetical protein
LLLASGETRKVLGQYGYLEAGNKLGYKIPHSQNPCPSTNDRESPLTDTKLMEFIEPKLTDFRSSNETVKKSIFERAKQYRESKKFSAKTFGEYSPYGTQSARLVDRIGVYMTHFLVRSAFLRAQ